MCVYVCICVFSLVLFWMYVCILLLVIICIVCIVRQPVHLSCNVRCVFSLVLTLQVSCQVQFQFVITSLLPFFQPYIARTVSTNTSNQSSRFHVFPVLCHSVKFEMSACFNPSSPPPPCPC
uniref:Uncharacterized protein n=1 Tax=Anopheles quadriannulatus TaxID=34691 RepID=A0A182XT60_ANOQN